MKAYYVSIFVKLICLIYFFKWDASLSERANKVSVIFARLEQGNVTDPFTNILEVFQTLRFLSTTPSFLFFEIINSPDGWFVSLIFLFRPNKTLSFLINKVSKFFSSIKKDTIYFR